MASRARQNPPTASRRCRPGDLLRFPARRVLTALSRDWPRGRGRLSAQGGRGDKTLTGLLLGLGAVALLVGGVGVANTMVISVLERKAEIGLRRSLGASRGQIRLQFLMESLILASIGGVGGVALGAGVTVAYGATQGWVAVVPAEATGAALIATMVIGALAGIYPAMRAARMSPTQALA